jgi:hypothetical protein
MKTNTGRFGHANKPIKPDMLQDKYEIIVLEKRKKTRQRGPEGIRI